ncbi:hypothetical protein HDU93_000328, partial [Gonapodya sp. JEL0774]
RIIERLITRLSDLRANDPTLYLTITAGTSLNPNARTLRGLRLPPATVDATLLKRLPIWLWKDPQPDLPSDLRIDVRQEDPHFDEDNQREHGEILHIVAAKKAKSSAPITISSPTHSTFSVRGTSCPICLEPYTPESSLRLLPCTHSFHADCVDSWLANRRGVCPLCRLDISTDGEWFKRYLEHQEHENKVSRADSSNTVSERGIGMSSRARDWWRGGLTSFGLRQTRDLESSGGQPLSGTAGTVTEITGDLSPASQQTPTLDNATVTDGPIPAVRETGSGSNERSTQRSGGTPQEETDSPSELGRIEIPVNVDLNALFVTVHRRVATERAHLLSLASTSSTSINMVDVSRVVNIPNAAVTSNDSNLTPAVSPPTFILSRDRILEELDIELTRLDGGVDVAGAPRVRRPMWSVVVRSIGKWAGRIRAKVSGLRIRRDGTTAGRGSASESPRGSGGMESEHLQLATPEVGGSGGQVSHNT